MLLPCMSGVESFGGVGGNEKRAEADEEAAWRSEEEPPDEGCLAEEVDVEEEEAKGDIQPECAAIMCCFPSAPLLPIQG